MQISVGEDGGTQVTVQDVLLRKRSLISIGVLRMTRESKKRKSLEGTYVDIEVLALNCVVVRRHLELASPLESRGALFPTRLGDHLPLERTSRHPHRSPIEILPVLGLDRSGSDLARERRRGLDRSGSRIRREGRVEQCACGGIGRGEREAIAQRGFGMGWRIADELCTGDDTVEGVASQQVVRPRAVSLKRNRLTRAATARDWLPVPAYLRLLTVWTSSG